MIGWKVVELVALVREEDAEELHNSYGRMTEYDSSKGAWVRTRDLTEGEMEDFAPTIEECEQEEP